MRDYCTFNSEEEIGKEIGHVHKLLCRLRHAGATRADLVKMRDAELAIFTEFLARLRGFPVDINDLSMFPLNIINLDYEPGICESVAELSGGKLTNDARLAVDCRLGIWPVKSEDGYEIIGDMKVAIEKPSHPPFYRGNGYCASDHIMGISKESVHLNLAMASWLSQDGLNDIPFDGAPFGAEWGNDCIFFLGTVWYRDDLKTYFAPTLSSNKKAKVTSGIMPIPKEEWPNNYYVALLVPR